MNGANQVPINHVKVGDRARKDLGDLTDLMESIQSVGLLHPLVVDGQMQLIAGQRRLEALRKLGYPTVEVRTAKRVKDAALFLTAERDENTCRKAMTATELKVLTEAIIEIERPAAAERQKATQAKPGEKIGQGGGLSATTLPSPKKSVEAAATAAGWSRTQYRRVSEVTSAAEDPSDPEVQAVAQEAQAAMDSGDITVSAAHARVRDAKAAKTPLGKLNRLSSDLRADQIRPLAERGMTSTQIAADLGITDQQVKKLAKAHGITIQADVVVGRQGQRVDSNRVVAESVITLSGVASGLALVDYDALDRSQVDGWLTSLAESQTALTRLKNQLRKVASDG